MGCRRKAAAESVKVGGIQKGITKDKDPAEGLGIESVADVP